MMWILFTVFAVLCVLSIDYALPSVYTLISLIAALVAAAFALLPKAGVAASDHVSFERIYEYDPSRSVRRQ